MAGSAHVTWADMTVSSVLNPIPRRDDVIVGGGSSAYSSGGEMSIDTRAVGTDRAVARMLRPHWGEAMAAVVVAGERPIITEQDVVGVCRECLANYEKAAQVVFRPDLSGNGSGNVYCQAQCDDL